MTYRYDEFSPGEIFHICTRGVNHENIFKDDADKKRFTALVKHCLSKKKSQSFSTTIRLKREILLPPASQSLVTLIAYCLMDNHVHLLVKENVEQGTSLFMQRLLNSYARYFNTRNNRSGPLFTGRFRAVLVDDDEQFLHVSRYIHLNPYVAHMINDPFAYKWSSLNSYVNESEKHDCHTELLFSFMNTDSYREFMGDDADYFQSLSDNQHVLIDND